ncbi:ecdysteroid 22-kinase family protein [Nocardia asteroides]|uniref:ecdysteroid 22-kinase family protein n=1 Tax=Nocardia asteroides TaxID=1824 RepID=UPI001E602D57|nr:ecdysteroid 22-kinase family protein [Nocardia asteroides]UGT64233.1 ecdysteroid 22-kinase family protein [Nocardia asteroides]
MTHDLPIPADWAEITPEWMTAALAADFPGVRVTAVQVTLRDDGTNRRARLGLEYAGTPGPRSVFVKAADPAHKELIKMTSGMYHEPRLFQSGLPLPIEHPAVHTALIDEQREDFLLVMEDLAERGADPRDATRPLTVDQAADGVRALARLHGTYWGVRLEQHPELAWLEPFVPWDGMEIAPLPAALDRLPDAPPAVRELTIGALIDDIWKPYIASLTTGPQTLLHGDAHIGNTYLLDGARVGFLDWQVARRGSWSLDLGYFLQGSLTIEDRRRAETDLLAEYRGALELPAAELPSATEIRDGYRASVAHGLTLWLCTASAGELWQRPDIALALAERYAAAYADLDTAGALAAHR